MRCCLFKLDLISYDYPFVYSACNVPGLDSGMARYELTKDDFTVALTSRDVMRHFMQYMFNMAKNSMQIVLDKLSVVLSVPVWSDYQTRQMIKDVAEEVGFEVLHQITEPSAAVLAYDLDQTTESAEYFMVFRAGGLTNDLTVMKNQNGLISIVSNKHVNDRKVCGNELTKAMVTYLSKEFYNKYKLDPTESRNALNKLTQHAEQCKHVLSTMPTAQIFIDSLMDGVDWEFKMTRARYEHLIQSTCQGFVKILDDCFEELKSCDIDEQSISKVILCGGSMKIPFLQQMFRKRLDSKIEVLSHLCGDEVISIGCAQHGKAILSLKHFDSTTDVEKDLKSLLKAIKINLNNETVAQFDEGDILPSVKRFQVASIDEEDTEIIFQVMEDATELGTLKLPVDGTLITDLNLSAHLKENGSIAIHW